MEVRLVVCVANKLFPSTNRETAAHFIYIPNPNKRFSPKFIPDQTFASASASACSSQSQSLVVLILTNTQRTTQDGREMLMHFFP